MLNISDFFLFLYDYWCDCSEEYIDLGWRIMSFMIYKLAVFIYEIYIFFQVVI